MHRGFGDIGVHNDLLIMGYVTIILSIFLKKIKIIMQKYCEMLDNFVLVVREHCIAHCIVCDSLKSM